MIVRSVSLLLLALIARNALAASFDCSKASNYAEKEIFRDDYLSTLDSMLSNEYSRAKEVSRDERAHRSSFRVPLT